MRLHRLPKRWSSMRGSKKPKMPFLTRSKRTTPRLDSNLKSLRKKTLVISNNSLKRSFIHDKHDKGLANQKTLDPNHLHLVLGSPCQMQDPWGTILAINQDHSIFLEGKILTSIQEERGMFIIQVTFLVHHHLLTKRTRKRSNFSYFNFAFFWLQIFN